MDNAGIDAKVCQVLASVLDRPPDEVTPTATLRHDLRMNGLDYIDVADQLEQEFDIDIIDAEMWDAQTVADVQRHVRECLEEKQEGGLCQSPTQKS